MKKIASLVLVPLLSQIAFAQDLVCVSPKGSLDQVQIKLSTTAFSTSEYSGSATVKIQGLYDSFMNVDSDKAIFMKLENNSGNPVVLVPLKNKGDGQVLIVFNDKKGKKASLQHVDVDDEYTVLSQLVCK